MDLASGSRIGRYEIRSLLGAGGMGEVYLAYDHDLERAVAMKVLRESEAGGGDRAVRFIQEARAASGLHHPNVAHVYEIGSHDDLRFIAMELVEGETLRDRIARGPVSFDDVVGIGLQAAAALAAAHKQGIIHRDIKPENIMVSADGYVKVLDFGLAKLREMRGQDAATVLKTKSGVAMGTIAYMPPEQLSGGEVTPAADVFSLGVVLYEMAAGRRPFAVASADDARPLSQLRPGTPPKLERVIARAMARNPVDRFPSAEELLEELRQISREATATATVAARARSPISKRFLIATVALLAVALVAAAIAMAGRAKRLRRAEASIAAAEELFAKRRLPEAYETAIAAAAILPANDRLREVIARSSTEASIGSDPPGAAVFLQRFKGPADRLRAGTTPLKIARLPLADYLVTFEKQGYAPVTIPFSLSPLYARAGLAVATRKPALQVKLFPATTFPAEMVFVTGGEYRLSGWSRPSDRPAMLSDFLIDRFEVSNRDFAEFVRAGGYRRPELWKQPFVDGGQTLAFDTAMARFRDSTGLPGPRGWSGGVPPAGRENHPVTGVTWYEAAAFAAWKGKKLPSVYQWEKAGRDPSTISLGTNLPWGKVGEGVDATERANFLRKGTMPVDSMPFGMSPWGAYHMAGNVAEWCRNPRQPGFAFRGGSWNDALYAFGQTGGYPAFYSSPTLGFRCVKELSAAGDQGDFALNAAEFVPHYQPVDDRTFAQLRARYDYPKTPLNARIIETQQAPEWERQTIAFDGAEGSTVTAYLYLPKGFRGPFQVIHFAPAGDVESGLRTLAASVEANFGPFIRGGRAVLAVVLEGYLDRRSPPRVEEPDSRSTEYVDYVVGRVTELRRGLDVIDSRSDLDHARIGFVAPSAGSWTGVILTALEPRYRSVMFIGSGIAPKEVTDAPAANRINFAPRIAAPKLILQGRYDEDTPFKSDAEPLFRLMSEPKRLQVYEGSHSPPAEIFVPAIQKWLDETLGPVR